MTVAVYISCSLIVLLPVMNISVFKMLSMLCPATGYPAAQLSKFTCFAMFYENSHCL